MFISYAQNFEDVILWRALKHVKSGFYIDVGAQDPLIDSVSLAFYEQGWRGVHVEPIDAYADKLRQARPDEEVIQSAISREEGEVVFFEIPDTGLSTGEERIARKHEVRGHTVKQVTKPSQPLSAILDSYKDREIHWMKIDVEGMENQVIESWAPSVARPWIVGVESTKPNSPESSHELWESKLLDLGYDFCYFDGLNRFYVSVEHPELRSSFGPGPNFFDDFALNGTASAPFCWKINAEAAELRSKLIDSQNAEAALEAHFAEEQGAKAEALGAKAVLEARLASERAATTMLEAVLAEEQAAKAEVLETKTALEARLADERATRTMLEADLAEEHGAKIKALEIKAALEASLAGERAARTTLQAILTEEQGAKAQALEVKATLEASLAGERASRTMLEDHLAAVIASTSWRITAPLRDIKSGVSAGARSRWLAHGFHAWVTLKPGSRPRRVARRAITGLASYLKGRPNLANGARWILRRFRAVRQEVVVHNDPELLPATSNFGENLRTGPSQHFKSVELDVSDVPSGVQLVYRQMGQARRHMRDGC
jgi:FkbM family methyltransferase